MSYTNPTKAIALAHELADKMKLRFSTLTVTESFDTDGLPLITINDGTPATTEKNMMIKVALLNWPLAKDILGNSANIYTPHVIQFLTEADSSSNYLGTSILPLIAEIALRGTAIEWYQMVNGHIPVAAGFTTTVSGNNAGLVASFTPDMYNGLTSQQ